MADERGSILLDDLMGQDVVLDLIGPYVCLGRLERLDGLYFELRDADLHDLRDTSATRENYLVDSKRFGIRKNRKRVLVRRLEVVAISRFADVMDS
jgi:hypothetical protein